MRVELKLDVDNVVAYLRALSVPPPTAPVRAQALSGGISNTVLLAEWDSGAVVVKQSLERLRVEAEWRFDRRRIFVERECLGLLARIAPGAAPEVMFTDPELYVLGMTAAPTGGLVWCEELRAGRRHRTATVAAAELLARLQATTRGAVDVARNFADPMPLLQGRVDPFHRTVAQRHPELAGAIDAEVERMLAVRQVLVHGDYSPKNVIAYPDRVLLLDCEVAHWGDPAFDVAFMLCHLLLDGYGSRTETVEAVADAAAFWEAYVRAGGVAEDERAVVAELACLSWRGSTASRRCRRCGVPISAKPSTGTAGGCCSTPASTASSGVWRSRTPTSTIGRRGESGDRRTRRVGDPRLSGSSDGRGAPEAVRRSDGPGQRTVGRVGGPARGGGAPRWRSRPVQRSRHARSHCDDRGRDRG